MAEATITPGDDGPYHVQGDFVLIDGSGNRLQITNEAWLCRCGQSVDKRSAMEHITIVVS